MATSIDPSTVVLCPLRDSLLHVHAIANIEKIIILNDGEAVKSMSFKKINIYKRVN
jgi:hypothetical protein